MKNNHLTFLTASTFFILFSCSPSKYIEQKKINEANRVLQEKLFKKKVDKAVSELSKKYNVKLFDHLKYEEDRQSGFTIQRERLEKQKEPLLAGLYLYDIYEGSGDSKEINILGIKGIIEKPVVRFILGEREIREISIFEYDLNCGEVAQEYFDVKTPPYGLQTEDSSGNGNNDYFIIGIKVTGESLEADKSGHEIIKIKGKCLWFEHIGKEHIKDESGNYIKPSTS